MCLRSTYRRCSTHLHVCTSGLHAGRPPSRSSPLRSNARALLANLPFHCTLQVRKVEAAKIVRIVGLTVPKELLEVRIKRYDFCLTTRKAEVFGKYAGLEQGFRRESRRQSRVSRMLLFADVFSFVCQSYFLERIAPTRAVGLSFFPPTHTYNVCKYE